MAQDNAAALVKGAEGGECNRGVCTTKNARWYNHSTRKWYCRDCAQRIMAWPESRGLLQHHPDPNAPTDDE
jgi:hypothetical protein